MLVVAWAGGVSCRLCCLLCHHHLFLREIGGWIVLARAACYSAGIFGNLRIARKYQLCLANMLFVGEHPIAVMST